MSQHHSHFPISRSGLNYALSTEPLLLNGMKVLFDQSASVYPVALDAKVDSAASQKSLLGNLFAEQKSAYSLPFTRGRADGVAVSGSATATNVDDWRNAGKGHNLQYAQDIKLWLNTIYPVSRLGVIYSASNDEKRKIIQRIFSVLKFGGLSYRRSASPIAGDPTANVFVPWDKPLAAALSHGGRVLIRVKHLAYGLIYPHPDYAYQHRLWNWIVTGRFDPSPAALVNEAAKLLPRAASTHEIKFDAEGPYEGKPPITNTTNNYGMNVAIGGEGGDDADGNPILANGLHGHLYLRHDLAREPNDFDCAMLIGCETTRPMDFEGDGGEGHLGTKHSLWGVAQPVSVTGGNKWEEINDPNGKPGKLDCMRVDIDSVDKLLRATTFGEVSALPAGQRLEEVIARYTGSDVGRDIFELHDRYRDTVEIWLRS